MIDAWISYNAISGELIGVHWAEPVDNCITISKILAESFIIGNNRLHDYKVVNNILERKTIENHIPMSFWSLQLLDSKDSGIEFVTEHNQIFILGAVGKKNLTIFATIKNDPSWLIQSWSLNSFQDEAGLYRIPFNNSENYSYYVGLSK